MEKNLSQQSKIWDIQKLFLKWLSFLHQEDILLYAEITILLYTNTLNSKMLDLVQETSLFGHPLVPQALIRMLMRLRVIMEL